MLSHNDALTRLSDDLQSSAPSQREHTARTVTEPLSRVHIVSKGGMLQPVSSVSFITYLAGALHSLGCYAYTGNQDVQQHKDQVHPFAEAGARHEPKL